MPRAPLSARTGRIPQAGRAPAFLFFGPSRARKSPDGAPRGSHPEGAESVITGSGRGARVLAPLQTSCAAAVAHALTGCDVRVATCVPGFGATQAFDAFSKAAPGRHPFSFHEEVAFNVAHGAALSGTRAAFLTKVHGLHKAANAFFDALTAGTVAGFVILVFEDKDGSHSDSVVDVLPFLRAAGAPHVTAGPQDAHARIVAAFAASERTGLPHVVVLDAADAAAPAPLPGVAPRLPAPPRFRRDPAAHLLCPLLAPYQRARLDARLAGAPLPAAPRLPRVPDDLPKAWAPTLRAYGRVFDAFRAVRGPFVAGDAGTCSVFGLPPYDAVDVTTCMGGSTALALGAHLAGVPDAWAVTGDFSFVAGGHLGLAEAYARDAPLKTLLLVNGEAAATGGQPLARRVLDRALAPYAADVRWTRADDKAALEATLREAAAHPGPRIVAVEV